MWNALLVCLCLFAASARTQLFEGSRCNYDAGITGTCRLITTCPWAISDLQNKIRTPGICTIDRSRNLPVVCCSDGQTAPPATEPPAKKPVTTKASNLDANGCPPIPKSATTLVKTGRKAIDKCIEYLDLVYPCEISNGLLLNAPKVRNEAGKCGFNAQSLVIGGQETKPNEFPHMVALGFDDPNSDEIAWQCGGSLVSDLWVLTAGHCTSTADLGDVSYALLGAHRKTVASPERTFNVVEIVKHPQYKSPSKYNDIALLKLDRKVRFSESVRPACLPTAKSIVAEKYIATGWGALSFGDKSGSDVLMKVRLEPFTFEECFKSNPASRQLKQGIIDDTQMCIGHHTEVKDTCQGDSGGPLQVVKPNISCMFDVIGVTSFGKACGTPNQPGVYTRVSYYTPWIESVIWP